jgi:prolyl-tRNA editing enzyme YbaK/EbsC (Cys-tRNA(Pro) deacylase)
MGTMDSADTRPLPAERDAEARGLAITLVRRDDDGTFDDAAAAQGLTRDDGVKTMVAKVGGGAVFVLIPGTRRLDWAKLRSLLVVNRASLVEPEAALEITGYAPGTITPLGSDRALPVYADQRILGRRVGMGSGSPDFLLFTDADPLLASLGATVGDITS